MVHNDSNYLLNKFVSLLSLNPPGMISTQGETLYFCYIVPRKETSVAFIRTPTKWVTVTVYTGCYIVPRMSEDIELQQLC